MLTWVEADADIYIHANTGDVNVDTVGLTIDMYINADIGDVNCDS